MVYARGCWVRLVHLSSSYLLITTPWVRSHVHPQKQQVQHMRGVLKEKERGDERTEHIQAREPEGERVPDVVVMQQRGIQSKPVV